MSALKNLLEQYIADAKRVTLGGSDTFVRTEQLRQGAEKILHHNRYVAKIWLIILLLLLGLVVGFMLFNLSNPEYFKAVFSGGGICAGGIFFWLHKLWKEKTGAEITILLTEHLKDAKHEDKLIEIISGLIPKV